MVLILAHFLPYALTFQISCLSSSSSHQRFSRLGSRILQQRSLSCTSVRLLKYFAISIHLIFFSFESFELKVNPFSTLAMHKMRRMSYNTSQFLRRIYGLACLNQRQKHQAAVFGSRLQLICCQLLSVPWICTAFFNLASSSSDHSTNKLVVFAFFY